MQEQLEARLTQKRSEVKSLNIKLESVQRKLSQSSADAEVANQQTTLTMTQAQQQVTGYAQTLLQVLHTLKHWILLSSMEAQKAARNCLEGRLAEMLLLPFDAVDDSTQRENGMPCSNISSYHY